METSPDQLFKDAMSGDPVPLAAAFAARQVLRAPLLRLLLGAAQDAPVAACHARIWQDIGPQMGTGFDGLLSWYLRDEARSILPERAAVHRDLLLRVLSATCVPHTETGFDLGFSAVRVLTGLPVDLAMHGFAARVLERMSDAWFQAEGQTLRPAMIFAALGTMDLGLIRRSVDIAGPERSPELRHAVDWGLSQLMSSQGGPDAWLAQTIIAEHPLDPESPASVHRMLWLGLLQDQHFRTFVPMLHAMRLNRDEPQLKPALHFAHAMAQQHEAPEEVLWLKDQLHQVDPGWDDPVQMFETGQDEQPALAARAAPAGLAPAVDLAACVAHARQLAGADIGLDTARSPDALAQAFASLVTAIATAPFPADWTFVDLLRAAESIRQLTLREFGWVAHFVQAPHAGGRPEYGTLDLAFFPVLHQGLLSVAAALCRAGLTWIETGHGAAGGWALARLIQTHSAAALEADAIGEAHGFLDRLETSGAMRAIIAVQRDETRLRAGQIAAAKAAPPQARLGSTVHPFLPRAEWSLAEGLHWNALVQDPALHGQFSILWPDGALRTYPHQTPARDVLLARARDVSLIAEGLLIGPNGTMLKPDPYHTSLNYPVESLTVLAGQGKAVRIRPAATRADAQPVLLLDGLASLHWPNYYHWMITHLSRIALAAERGLLDHRKLVLPEGMKAWTLDSLDLIGVTERHRMIVPPSHLIRFGDVAILSSIEHLSPAAIHAMRARFLGDAARVTAPPKDGAVFYLSRRSRALRKLVNEVEIEAIARAMGFKVIAPEDYSIAEQRTLFAAARGIAAPEGAALTNMIFAAPGTRVLSVLCQNDMLPIFNDLALVLGQAHRKMPGAGLGGMPGGTRFQPHYRIAPDLARQGLAWVLEGAT